MRTPRLLLLLLSLLPIIDGNCQKIMTWNIRYNNPGDGINAWPNRKEKIFTLLKDINPAIICLQEALDDQVKDVAQALPGYAWAGVGRDDGGMKGEYVPVFYQKDKFKLIKSGYFWLSETPDIPGKLGWDAACPRMVTWLILVGKSKDTLAVFNTHFDHIGVTARIRSAELLVHAADSIAGNHAVIITGDFNATPSDTPYPIITGAGFHDSRIISTSTPQGPGYTFTGFPTSGKPGHRIDFIFVRKTKPVKTHQTNDESYQGSYLSDHLPVIVGF